MESHLRARYYNSVVGRFTQEDIYRGDGLNLYAYCGNNPVGYYDPSGYCGELKERSFANRNELVGDATVSAPDELNKRFLSEGGYVYDFDNLPGADGIVVSERLNPEEMMALQKEYGVEFSLVYEMGPEKNGGGGVYRLYSGIEDKLKMKNFNYKDTRWIYHTHPANRPLYASIDDMDTMQLMKALENPQRVSRILPIDGREIRFSSEAKDLSEISDYFKYKMN